VKILLYCPTYKKDNGELALHKETQESISGLEIPNSVELTVNVDAYNPKPIVGRAKEDHENTLLKYKRARQKVLNENYDALFTVEHDMIVPENALVKMLDTKADVIYGLYCFRHITPMLNALRAVSSDWPDMSMSFFPEYIKKGKRRGWIECSGSGMGCTLIYRRVLEKLDFHRAKSGHPVPDMPLAADCLQNGFKQVCRFDVPCGHIKRDGSVLWPFKNGGGTMENIKIYVYRTFNASVAGQTRHFEEGENTEIPENCAGEFVRAGFIGIIPDKPAVKIVKKPRAKTKKAVK